MKEIAIMVCFFIQTTGPLASDLETSSQTSLEADDPGDESFQPETTSSDEEEEEEDVGPNGKVLVDEERITSLFKFCQTCGKG